MPTVGPDVALALSLRGDPPASIRPAVDAALAQVNLPGFFDRPTQTLSGGQKQRVAIAGALVQGARLLLCDELTTFLDAEEQTNILRVVRGIVDAGRGDVTAVWVTHRLEELAFADSASWMDRGGIRATGEPGRVRDALLTAQRG